jgi:hypothetical protein
MVSPPAKREAVSALMNERGFGVTRACGLVWMSRSLYRYRSVRSSKSIRSVASGNATFKRR